MKSKIVISLFVFLLSVTYLSARSAEFGDFHRILSKHGNWIEIRNVGLVWTPTNVERGWEPYTNGRWYWTEFGWFWDSADPFGWITHHYGRWNYDDWYGWVWHPGYEWAPAWVKWRISGDYIGWRPLTPNARFNYTTGISYSNSRSTIFSRWNFVKKSYLNNHSIRKHLIKSHKITEFYKHSEPITDYYVYNGIVYCGTFLPDSRFKRIKNEIRIGNLNYINDFYLVNEFGFDYWLGIPHGPSPPPPPGPSPEPRPHPRSKIPPVVIKPLPARPPEKASTQTPVEYRDPVPSRPVKGIQIKKVPIRNNEVKNERIKEIEKTRKVEKERALATKHRSQ